jgi:hypothetical protein
MSSAGVRLLQPESDSRFLPRLTNFLRPLHDANVESDSLGFDDRCYFLPTSGGVGLVRAVPVGRLVTAVGFSTSSPCYEQYPRAPPCCQLPPTTFLGQFLHL